jgi:hypothetical protein
MLASSMASAATRVLRLGAIGIGTGVLVAALVGGIGSRIVMRLLFLGNEATKGSITENGNEVGVITLGGTASLVFFIALFLGVPGGLMYVVTRRWLTESWLVRGLLYGALLLLLFGGGAIDSDNIDFRIFGPVWLGIALFGLLPFLFGLGLAYLVDRWDPYVPTLFRRHWVTVGGHVVLVVLAILGVVDFAGTVDELL